MLGRSSPDLNFWREFVALTNCSDPNEIRRAWHIREYSVNRRSASGAKSLDVRGSAFRRFHIDSRLARQREFVGRNGNADPKCRTREILAVCAMTDFDLFRVDFRLVGDHAAMTRTVDFHWTTSSSI